MDNLDQLGILSAAAATAGKGAGQTSAGLGAASTEGQQALDKRAQNIQFFEHLMDMIKPGGGGGGPVPGATPTAAAGPVPTIEQPLPETLPAEQDYLSALTSAAPV